MATDVVSYQLPSERAELARSEEEEALLRDIRDEKERLWVEIQVRVVRDGNLLQTSAVDLFDVPQYD